MKVFVSFIVIAYQNSETLNECLSSVESQRLNGDELILVLNNPDPQTKSEAVKNKNWIIVSEPCQGPQFARNSGVKHAKNEILCFLDADVYLPLNWRLQMVMNFQNPWVAIGQSKVRIIKKQSLLNFIQRYNSLKFNGRFYFEKSIEYKSVLLSLDTAAMMVRKEWFNRVGGFDEEFSRLEDTDFSLRIMYHGGDIFFEDRVCAYEIFDPKENLISYIRKFLKSVSLTPLLYQKHQIKMTLPFANRFEVSKFKMINQLGTILDVFFQFLEILGLAMSPHRLDLNPTKYIRYVGNPKKSFYLNGSSLNERSVWVGGVERFYDLRKNIYSRKLT